MEMRVGTRLRPAHIITRPGMYTRCLRATSAMVLMRTALLVSRMLLIVFALQQARLSIALLKIRSVPMIGHR